MERLQACVVSLSTSTGVELEVVKSVVSKIVVGTVPSLQTRLYLKRSLGRHPVGTDCTRKKKMMMTTTTINDVGCWIDWNYISSRDEDATTTICIVLSDTTLVDYHGVITAEQMIARCLMEILVRHVGSGGTDVSDGSATSDTLRVMSKLPTIASILSAPSSLLPSTIMSIHGLPTTFDDETRRGVPGKFLLPHDATSLMFSPLHPYVEDEIIATMDSSKRLLRGARGARGGESDLDYASIDRSTLVYGVVLRSSASSDHGLRRLQVRCGDGLHSITLLSTEVFSFAPTTPEHSTKREAASSSESTRAAALPSLLPSSQGGETKKSTANNISNSNSNNNNNTTTNRTTDAGDEQAVNSKELMDAVDAILGSVGMPLSRDQKNIMSETIELRRETQHQKKEIRKLSTENEAYKDRLLCKICMSSDVDRMLLPSGKMICRGCVNKINGVCPFTRKSVEKVIKLYF
jgi:hypothetical protein